MSLVFSLTGGIGVGKSTVSRVFSELGVGIVDADEIAREVVVPGTRGLEIVTEEFGNDILQSDGSLDRRKLGSIVFVSKDALGKLNEALLPFILERANKLIEQKCEDHDFVCFDAPTLMEAGLHVHFRPVVLILAPQEDQVQRVMARGFSEAEAWARVKSQMPQEERASKADYLIYNSGTLAELRDRARHMKDHLAANFHRWAS